jgi:hypothetical protein
MREDGRSRRRWVRVGGVVAVCAAVVALCRPARLEPHERAPVVSSCEPTSGGARASTGPADEAASSADPEPPMIWEQMPFLPAR